MTNRRQSNRPVPQDPLEAFERDLTDLLGDLSVRQPPDTDRDTEIRHDRAEGRPCIVLHGGTVHNGVSGPLFRPDGRVTSDARLSIDEQEEEPGNVYVLSQGQFGVRSFLITLPADLTVLLDRFLGECSPSSVLPGQRLTYRSAEGRNLNHLAVTDLGKGRIDLHDVAACVHLTFTARQTARLRRVCHRAKRRYLHGLNG